MQQDEERKGREKQNHAQVIAESERIDRVEQGKAADRWPVGPCHEGKGGGPYNQQVERVDLCSDGLGPEGVRECEKQAGSCTGDQRLGDARAKQDSKTDGNRAVSGRCEIEGPGGLSRVKPGEEISEAVIEGIGPSRCQCEKTDAGLERRAIAEIEAGDEGRVVTEERNGRDSRGD